MTLRLPRIELLLVALAVATVITACPAAAQTGAAETAPEVLERTDEILQDLAPLIQDCDSEQARRIFEDAGHKQQQARRLLAEDRPVFAIRLSQRAREAARVAERLARTSLQTEEPLRHRLERLIETWEQVRDRAREAGNAQALRFVQEAETLYRRARGMFDQTRYEQAFALLQSAETQLNRAVRLLFEAGGAEQLDQELDRTADLISLAAVRLSEVNDPALDDQLDRAAANLDRARAALSDQRPLLALRFARQARDQAQRVLRQLGPVPDVEGIREQIGRFDAQQVRAAEAVRTSGDPAALRRLERARDMRDQAAQALDRGELERALRRIRTALDLQRQAAEGPR